MVPKGNVKLMYRHRTFYGCYKIYNKGQPLKTIPEIKTEKTLSKVLLDNLPINIQMLPLDEIKCTELKEHWYL